MNKPEKVFILRKSDVWVGFGGVLGAEFGYFGHKVADFGERLWALGMS